MNPVLDFSERVAVLPVVHGSAEFAMETRKRLKRTAYDCLAVALPQSFAAPVEESVRLLPQISVVLQDEATPAGSCNYVPVDPCQGVIAAIREAMESDLDRAYIDLEVAAYESESVDTLDPYALAKLPLEKFLTALVATLPAPKEDQRIRRIAKMAHALHVLELEYERIVLVCSAADWPWIRSAYMERLHFEKHEPGAGMPQMFRAAMESLCFVLGELPFITQIYEHRRAELLADESQSIDGVKSLLLRARDCLSQDRDRLTPQCLSQVLTYLRNLTVMDGRLAPDLYLALAAKQVVDDDFALAVVEASREYPAQLLPSNVDELRMGIGKLVDADGNAKPCKNRLEGIPRVWRKLPTAAHTSGSQKAKLGASVGSFYPMFVSSGGQSHRELSTARACAGEVAHGGGSRSHRKIHLLLKGWTRRPRVAAELAHGRTLRARNSCNHRKRRGGSILIRHPGRREHLQLARHLVRGT